MRTKNIALLVVAVLAGTVQVDLGGISRKLSLGESRVFAADKEKTGFPLPSGDLLGFTGKGDQPMALEQIYPGINGALLLTDEQKQQILEAREEIMGSDAIKAAGQKAKLDPNATEAEKEASRNIIKEARTRLQQKISGILTADQKALVAKINTASEEVQKAVRESLGAQLVAAKGNPDLMADLQRQMREKHVNEMTARLAGILTAEQNAAYQKATADQKAAEEKAKDKTKPTK